MVDYIEEEYSNMPESPPDDYTDEQQSSIPPMSGELPNGAAPHGGIVTWADLQNIVGPVRWMWRKWLPYGLLTAITSDSGVGKSALLLWLFRTVICGDPWPDGTPYLSEPGAVVWCESEAAQAINLDRAKAWGIPLDKIYSPLDDPMEDFRLDDKYHLAKLSILAKKPEVRMIVLDSLSGANSRGRDESGSSMLTMVKWLAMLARDSEKPVLFSHHLRKKSFFDSNIVTLDRVRGHSSIVQTSRVVWALDIPDPNCEARRLSEIKNNLSPFPAAVGMTISESGLSFGDAPETPRVETTMDRACEILLALLDNEPVKSTQIETEAKSAGISWRTFMEAKKKLRIISARKEGSWYWSLPANG